MVSKVGELSMTMRTFLSLAAAFSRFFLNRKVNLVMMIVMVLMLMLMHNIVVVVVKYTYKGVPN